jgi:hypothetical protein
MEGYVFKVSDTWFVDAGEHIFPILVEENVNYAHLDGKKVYFEIGEECGGETWSPVYAKLTNMSNKSLYSDIELAIIEWNIDGTKTAGELTRKILKIMGK